MTKNEIIKKATEIKNNKDTKKIEELEKNKLKLKMINLFNDVFSTDKGIEVLYYIKVLSGYNKLTAIQLMDGNINKDGMIHKEGRRSLYYDIEKLIDIETLEKFFSYELKKRKEKNA